MKKLLILSGKGGTGKTTTAAAFIKFSKARAFADCDIDAPNLHLVQSVDGQTEKSVYYGSDKAYIDSDKCTGCGICAEKCRFSAIKYENGKYTVDEYACEGCGVCVYVCPNNAAEMKRDAAGELALHRGGGRVFSTAVLKMGRGNSGKLVTEVKSALMKNAGDARFAVIDGSPGIGCPVISSVSGVDLVLIVAEPSLSGLSDLKRLVKTASVFAVKTAVCVNKYDVSEAHTAEIEKFCADSNIPFAGRVPYDKKASEAVNNGVSIAEIECPARDALYKVYENIMSLMGESSEK